MKWPILTIDDIKADRRHACVGGPFGSELTRRDYVEDGVPVVRGVNLPSDEQFLDAEFVFVSEQKADQLIANTAQRGDIIFTQRGTLGQVGLIPEDAKYDRYVVSQSQMKLTVDENKVFSKYLFYFFRQKHIVNLIIRRAITSGVPHINLGILKSLEVIVPPVDVQRRIVTFLDAYSGAIENNRRRIELLEESARLLFKEWFVRLRYPGHKHDAIVGGLPVKWEKTSIGSVCVNDAGVQTGPFGSQLHESDYTLEGIPVVMPRDLIGFRINKAKIAKIPEGLADRLARHRMAPGDVVYGRRGDIGRRAVIGQREAGWLCGTGCLRLRPDPAKVAPRFFFDALGHPTVVGTIMARAQGATMPNLNTGLVASVSMVIPPRALQDEYADQVEDRERLLEKLGVQNEKLVHARDLLLPRLMDGRISV